MRLFIQVVFVLFMVLPGPLWAADGPKIPGLVKQVEDLFTPGRDWADIKFTADGIADPSKDTPEARQEIERLTVGLKDFVTRMRPKTAHDKLQILKAFLYKSGPWNDEKTYSYDLADPLGKIRIHRYLSNYLEGRKGNCITMPILFAILGKRIGLNMTLAVAPRHMFVKFTDDEGKEWNIETTSGGGYTRESHIREQSPMTDASIQKGLYLKVLTNEEAIATMAEVVAEERMRQQLYEQAIAISDVLLKHNPKSVVTILKRGSAFGAILQRDILSRYTRVDELTPDQLKMAEALSYHNQKAFETATALGWTENDGEKDRWPPQQVNQGKGK
jgi:regulator of sirC expression with transglutaminase-like and TPR domain